MNGKIERNQLTRCGLFELEMDMVRTFFCCDTKNTRFWRGVGIAIGWMSLLASTWLIYEVLLTHPSQSTIISIIYIILVIFLNVNQYICKYVTIFLCGEFARADLNQNLFPLTFHLITFSITKNTILQLLIGWLVPCGYVE